MAKRKHFYAIARGNCPPMISQCWAVVELQVNGYPKNQYKGFATFEEAKSYLGDAGHNTFHFDQGPADGPKSRSPLNPDNGHPEFYSVARGRETGIRQTYGATRVLVEKHSGACYKSFATKDQAEAFLEARMAALEL